LFAFCLFACLFAFCLFVLFVCFLVMCQH
jgi:hypothetical protein